MAQQRRIRKFIQHKELHFNMDGGKDFIKKNFSNARKQTKKAFSQKRHFPNTYKPEIMNTEEFNISL